MSQHENGRGAGQRAGVPAVGFAVVPRAYRPTTAVVRGVRLSLFIVAKVALGRPLEHGRDRFLIEGT